MDQTTIFDAPVIEIPTPTATEARARNTDPGTSHEAARSVSELRRKQFVVWEMLFSYGPMTDEEIAERYAPPYPPQSPSGLRTRRRELVDAGLVRDTGERKRTKANRRTIVWEIDPEGKLE